MFDMSLYSMPLELDTEVFLTGDNSSSDMPSIPGGWGAAGQPNDGWRNHLHALVHAFCQASVDWHSSVDLRKKLDELQMSVQSSVSTK